MIITLYGKPSCPYCDRAEDYLKRNGFEYKKVDISEDEKAREFVLSQGHRSVPQIYLEDRVLVEGGYDGLSKLLPDELTKRIQQYANGKDL